MGISSAEMVSRSGRLQFKVNYIISGVYIMCFHPRPILSHLNRDEKQ